MGGCAVNYPVLNVDYENVLDAIENPIHIIDSTERLVFVNAAWERMMGKSRRDVLNQHINLAIADSMQGYYLSIERDRSTRNTRFHHFDKKLLESVALVAL